MEGLSLQYVMVRLGLVGGYKKKCTSIQYKTIVVQKIFPVNPYFYNFLVLSLINLSAAADFIVYIP